MSTISYAIEITTDATTVTNASYGITAGIFRFITGRPSYAGSPTYPTGEAGIATATLQAHWYEGWINDRGIGSASRSIDVTVAGDYGTMSGFSFSLAANKATDAFWTFCEDNSIHFTNRTVSAYTVIDDVFYYLWSGVIENNPYDDEDFKFDCIDKFRSVHKEIPPQPVTVTAYPDSTDETATKVVPISLGDIGYANLVNITGDPEWINLMKLSTAKDPLGVYYKSAPVYEWDVTTNKVSFLTPNMDTKGNTSNYIVDTVNSSYYAFLVQGSELATKASESPETNVGIPILSADDEIIIHRHIKFMESTSLTLLDNIGISQSCTSPQDIIMYPLDIRLFEPDPTVSTSEDVWWLKIGKIDIQYKISSNEIQSFYIDNNGMPLIYAYDSRSKSYTSIGSLIKDYDYTNGIITIRSNKNMTTSGGFNYITPIKCIVESADIKRTEHLVSDTYDYYQYIWQPLSASEIVSLTDVDRTTYVTTEQPEGQSWGEFSVFKAMLAFDDKDDFSKYSTIFFGLDMTVETSDRPFAIKLYLNGVNPLGSAVEDTDVELFYPADGYYVDDSEVPYTINMFNNDYYTSLGKSDNDEISIFSTWNNLKYAGSNTWTVITGATGERIKRKLEIPSSILNSLKTGISSKIYVRVSIIFDDYKEGAAKINFKELGFQGYVEQELATDDMYISLHGELDPDGVLTNNVYRAFKHIMETYDGIATADIDYGNVSSVRTDWHVGRQIVDRQSSFNYLKQLCNHSFVSIYPARSGKRSLTAWIEDTTTPIDFNESNILRDSVKGIEKTPVSKAYNDYVLNYAWDPGRRKYMKSFYVTKAQETAFPAESGAWSEYCGGFPANAYVDAYVLWKQVHAGYASLKCVTPQLPDTYAKLPWYTDPSIWDSTSPYTGTNSSAYKFLKQMIEWATIQKDIVKYSLPITASNMQLELLDRIRFADNLLTDGTWEEGWITGISVNANDNKIDITAILTPYEMSTIQDTIIIERGSVANVDTITERGSVLNTNTYTETGVS